MRGRRLFGGLNARFLARIPARSRARLAPAVERAPGPDGRVTPRAPLRAETSAARRLARPEAAAPAHPLRIRPLDGYLGIKRWGDFESHILNPLD